MNPSIRILSLSFGIFAAIGGLEHGYFEVLQGHITPESIMIQSMGSPCIPEEVWHLCEPAMTIMPDMFITGILSISLGLLTLIWSVFFIQRQYGGWILMGFSILLLLFGGGIFPPIIGMIGGIIGTRINKPLKWGRSTFTKRLARFLSLLWPWVLIIFFVWLFSQWTIGYYFNEFMKSTGYVIPGVILGLMLLCVLSAMANDAIKNPSKY